MQNDESNYQVGIARRPTRKPQAQANFHETTGAQFLLLPVINRFRNIKPEPFFGASGAQTEIAEKQGQRTFMVLTQTLFPFNSTTSLNIIVFF